MKVFLRKLVERILMSLAKSMLKKHNPDVVGITGSVGKSSTKEAVYMVLGSNKSVRRSEKNYNNEIGLPLTIIGIGSAGFNIFAWIINLVRALFLILFSKKYPEILVLEMGADRPGDIGVLSTIAKPNVGIVTSVGPSHLEYFSGIDEIAREKGTLIANLPRDGYAILNNDDPRVRIMQDRTGANVITYGFSGDADVYVDIDKQAYLLDADRWISEKGRTKSGMSFKVYCRGNIFPIRMPRVVGMHYIYIALAAISCGVVFKIDFADIERALVNYKPPVGRMNLIEGIKQTLLIDDTYNSAPVSAVAAIDSLSKIKTSGRKIAVLGDMFELGVCSEKGHEDVGIRASEVVDILITVGPLSEITQAAFIRGKGNLSTSTFHFRNSVEAGKALQDILKEKDVVLVKGSQGMRMERVVKEIMLDPLRAKELLVRQDSRWLKKK